jgi:hypothetical protein
MLDYLLLGDRAYIMLTCIFDLPRRGVANQVPHIDMGYTVPQL